MNPFVVDALALLVVIAAVLAHVGAAFLGRSITDTTFIDNAALLVLGVAFGRYSNGADKAAASAAKAAADAHARLDALGVPPASSGAPQP